MGRTFASLRFYNYRVWFLAALVANTGTWMQRVAQDWLVLAVLTHDSAFAVGPQCGERRYRARSRALAFFHGALRSDKHLPQLAKHLRAHSMAEETTS